MQKRAHYITLISLAISVIILIPLEQKVFGWTLLGITGLSLLFCEKPFRKDMILAVLSFGLLGITPINTSISYGHILHMGTILTLAVLIPYLTVRCVYKQKTIRFPFHHGRRWYKSEIMYIVVTATIMYLLLPFYLKNTGSYHNWTVTPGAINLFTLFVVTNGLGIWDELFFVSTVLAIFKKHFSFTVANAAQAVFFTAFLFELGFRGWAPFVLYPFALSQGYIFKKTDSLLYVITIHLTLDLVLYLALIHAYYPEWLKIFIT
jgi:membrane protease YdiL (CAAX protease family)